MSDFRFEGKCKVKRIYSDCCGMEEGTVYEAICNFGYVNVKISDEYWTTPHFAEGFFELVSKDEAGCREVGG